MSEPRLRPEDLEAWASWSRAAAVHARSLRFQRRVDGARRVIGDALTSTPTWCAMWSGGKDSTVLTHLLMAEGVGIPVASEKDDLDYPGEREYVERLGAAWSLDLRILTPSISPAAWLADHGRELDVEGDMHGRAAELSKRCFYGVVEDFSAAFDGVMLGLRKDESHGRMMNRVTRGPLYQKHPTVLHRVGQWVAAPLSDWSGLDVYAYAAVNGVELLPLYQCIAFMHRDEPWRVRKSWWLPGASARHGGVAWLRHYFPSLFDRLCQWMPAARRLA